MVLAGSSFISDLFLGNGSMLPAGTTYVLGVLVQSQCKEAVLRIIWKKVNAVCNLCALMEILQPGGKVVVSSGCLAGSVHCIGRLHPALSGKWMHSHKTALVS